MKLFVQEIEVEILQPSEFEDAAITAFKNSNNIPKKLKEQTIEQKSQLKVFKGEVSQAWIKFLRQTQVEFQSLVLPQELLCMNLHDLGENQSVVVSRWLASLDANLQWKVKNSVKLKLFDVLTSNLYCQFANKQSASLFVNELNNLVSIPCELPVEYRNSYLSRSIDD